MSNPASRKSSGKGPRYQSPKERPPKRQWDKKRWGERLTKLGAALKPLAFSHPVIVGLGLMTATQLSKAAVLMTADPKDLTYNGAVPLGRGAHYTPKTGSRQDVLFTELQGLYDAAAGVTTAVVAVPLISAAATVAGDLLSTRKGVGSGSGEQPT